MKKRLMTTLALSGLLLEGAAPAMGATPAHLTSATAQHSTVSAAMGASNDSRTSGGTTLALGAPSAHQAQAVQPERRRYRTRTRHRSGIGRFFGAVAFLFIGLPLLIILALILWFMLRRNRKRREQQMMNSQGMGQQWQGGGQPPYGQGGPNGRF